MSEPVTVNVEEEIGWLTLNRPDRLNSITRATLASIQSALDGIETADVGCVVIRGAGDRAFSTGADLDMLAEADTAAAATDLSRAGQRICDRLERSPLPVIAAIDGYCLGGGLELAAASDIRLATDRSTFGLPEPQLGLLPGWGGTQRLPRLIGESPARDIILSGAQYSATEFHEMGFLADVLTPATLEDRVSEWTDRFVTGPPGTYAKAKRAIRAGREGVRAGLETEARLFGEARASDDADEGLSAAREDREPDFGSTGS